MEIRFVVATLILTLANTAQAQKTAMEPPKVEARSEKLTAHGETREDEYYWLRERENAQVIAYLEAENDYLKAQLASTDKLQAQLAEETKARIKQTDESVPYPDNGFSYFRRTVDGLQYPIYCRTPLEKEEAVEQVLLDVNEIAAGKSYCSVNGLEVSEDTKLLAYAVDTVGRRKYTLKIRDLESGKTLSDEIADVTGNHVWANDNKTLFYVRQDPTTLRWYQIYRHVLGDDPAHDKLVFEEKDEEFSCYISKSRSRKFLLIYSEQTLSSETRYLDANNPDATPIVFQAREADHEYSVDHLNDQFYVRTNWDAANFRLMQCGEQTTGKSHWKVVEPHHDDVFLNDFDLFDNYLALEQRHHGLIRIRLRDWSTGAEHDLDFGEACYQAGTEATPVHATDWLRYSFSSMITPNSTFEYNMRTKEKKLLKQTEVLGGYDSSDYKTERLWVEARDGAKVPVSIVYRQDTPLDGTAPCLQYAYGSYGNSMEASFRSSRLNLLDRGFVYAIAHIRGGQEMGRHWYEEGKLLKKKNTFTDFIDVGRALIAKKYADPKRLYGRGGSAGGLLMGAVANMAPELYHGLIADVPFVDVVTTMLDDTIPLTTSEYDEWGNPNDPEYYAYMLSYSPYDNVREMDYPNLLVTSGLHDSQVQYWEPTKWVARLRAKKTDDNLLLLKTNMSAGHGGASGRYEQYKEIALRDAFLLFLAGISR
jgi:oligopeptidase B